MSESVRSPLRQVVCAFGSNIGDRFAFLQGAISMFARRCAAETVRLSSIYETMPVDYLQQPDFLNAVVCFKSPLEPQRLLQLAFEVENHFGRVRDIPKGPRTIDIDLIAVDSVQLATPELTLPHPQAKYRAFVLLPWFEIDPLASLLPYGRVSDILRRLDTSGVRKITNMSLQAGLEAG